VGAELAGEGRARADMLPAHGTLRKANGHDDRSIAAGEARQRRKAARESRRRQKQTMEQAHGKAPVDAVTAASLARRRREFNAMRAA
jgi:hypothetical protein